MRDPMAITAPGPDPVGEFRSPFPDPVPGPEATAPGAVVGRLAGFGADGAPLVEVPSPRPGRPRPARASVALGPRDVGREVVLVFERSDPSRPIVLGVLGPPPPAPDAPEPFEATIDGNRLVIEARDEVVLRCGEASITLTRAGKILIRGAYLSTRSTGVTRIKGPIIQVN